MSTRHEMDQFTISSDTMRSIEAKVQAAAPNYNNSQILMATPKCGCGAGGTCASSCVSGCAERGGYPR